MVCWMSEQNDQSIAGVSLPYRWQMLDILKPILFEELHIFVKIHFCLGLISKEKKRGTSVENIFNDAQKVSPPKELDEIQLIFSDLGIKKLYIKILKSKHICSLIDELTKNEINRIKDYKQNINQKLQLLEFFTQSVDGSGPKGFSGRGPEGFSTKGLDQFIDHLVLNDCTKGSILFPYLQNAFLPIKCALLNPNAKVTAFEINTKQYAFAKLLKLFFNLQPLQLINTSWLHSSLGEADEIELFNIIINTPPLGLSIREPVPDPENYPPEFNRSVKTTEVYEQHKMLRHLKEGGSGYLLTGRSFAFASRNVFKFARKKLLTDGNIQTILKLPGDLLSATSIDTILFHITKKTNSKVQFIDTNECFRRESRFKLGFSEQMSSDIFGAISSRNSLKHRVKLVSTKDLIDDNCDLDPNRFVDNSEAAQTRRRLLANYSDYEEVSLGSESVCKSIRRYSTVSDFKPETSVILPQIPTKNLKPTSQIGDIRPGHYVIELNTTKLLPGYLLHFLKSELGQLTLELAARSAYIPTLSIKDVRELKIPLPLLDVQKNIETAFNKLEAVNLEVSNINRDLSSSPTNVETLSLKLDEILGVLTELTEPEKAFNKILQGEGEYLEFKETFSLDVRRIKNDENYEAIKENKIEHSSLKTIAAFMNTKGGDLFIGVDDDAVVIGVDEEIGQFHRGSLDKYLLHLHNRIQDRFETPIINLLSVKTLNFSGKTVINLQVLPSKKDPIFLNPDSGFYVRSTPATEKLTGNFMFTYIKDRFSLT